MILQIIALNIDAILTLKDLRNINFLILIKFKKKSTRHYIRENISLVKYYLVYIILCTNHYLYNLLRDQIFSRNKNNTNFILRTQIQGVSDLHFNIDYNQRAINLMLINLLDNSTKIINLDTSKMNKIITLRVILLGEQY